MSPEVKFKVVDPMVALGVIGLIYKALRPWLVEMAKKSETPVDDKIIAVLDMILGVQA